MAKLVIATLDVEGERFPKTYIEIDGQRWLIRQTGRVAYALEEIGRLAVSSMRRESAEFEVEPL